MFVKRHQVKPLIIFTTSLLVTSCSVKPILITQDERSQRIKQDWHDMFSAKDTPKKSINIYESMALAVKHNLDLRLKYMEQAYAKADTQYASASMLPALVTDASYAARNNPYSVRSPTNPDSLTSTEDRDQHEARLQFSWNALDFGISYIEAKQKSDLYLISQERKRKIIQKIIQDSRFAYWRAWASQKLVRKIPPFIKEINTAINMSHRSEEEKLISPAKAAFFRAELWQTYAEINSIYSNLTQAKPELMSLMNLNPSSDIRLIKPTQSNHQLPKGFPLKSSNKLQNIALKNRPELREEDYQKRARIKEVTKAKLKFLPSVSLNAGLSYDSNSFLVNNEWADFATKLSWDVLHMFTKYYGLKTAETDVQVADIRRKALSMSVLTQVEIARLAYLESGKNLMILRKVKDNRYQHYLHLSNEHNAELSDKLSLISAKSKLLLAKLRYDLAFAEWCNAAGQLLTTVGYDPLYQVSSLDVSVKQLAEKIKNSLTHYPKTNQKIARIKITNVGSLPPKKSL